MRYSPTRNRRSLLLALACSTSLCTPALAEEFESKIIDRLFHIVIVHEENGVPVQLEDRYVNADVVPAFLEQDFSRTTPTAMSMAGIITSSRGMTAGTMA